MIRVHSTTPSLQAAMERLNIRNAAAIQVDRIVQPANAIRALRDEVRNFIACRDAVVQHDQIADVDDVITGGDEQGRVHGALERIDGAAVEIGGLVGRDAAAHDQENAPLRHRRTLTTRGIELGQGSQIGRAHV